MFEGTGVADAWSISAAQLAAATLNLVVVDQHNWYSFRPLTERKHGFVLQKNGNLTQWTLQRHFVGEKVDHLVAIPASAVIPSYHAISTWGWIGFDIHVVEDRGNSWEVTQHVGTELSDRGLAFLIEDYGGEGNYHVWIPLRRESQYDMDEAYGFPARQFAGEIISVIRSPLLFAANVLPLPGRHHTLDAWSRFWDGGKWLEGEAATHYWLGFHPGPLPYPRREQTHGAQDSSQTSHEELETTTAQRPDSATLSGEIIERADTGSVVPRTAREHSKTPEVQVNHFDASRIQPITSNPQGESITEMREGRYKSFAERMDSIDHWESENYGGRELDSFGGSMYHRSSRSWLANLTEIDLQVMPEMELRALYELSTLRAREYGQVASRHGRTLLAISAATIGSWLIIVFVLLRGIQGLLPNELTFFVGIGAVAFALWTGRRFGHWLRSKYFDEQRDDRIRTQAWKWRQVREVSATALATRATPR